MLSLYALSIKFHYFKNDPGVNKILYPQGGGGSKDPRGGEGKVEGKGKIKGKIKGERKRGKRGGKWNEQGKKKKGKGNSGR